VANGLSAADRPLRLGGGLGGTCGRATACVVSLRDGRRRRGPGAARDGGVGRAGREALSPLLGWGDADLVYVTYGKIWFPLFVAFTLCAFVIYKQRRPGLWETWVWRVALTGYVLACAGVFLDYWTQWTGNYNVLFQVGWIVTVPGLLLTMLGSTVLGITLLLRGSAARLPALLLALAIPLAWLILQATSLGNAVLPVMFAFGILGRRLASGSAVAEFPAAEAPAR
jgi:hypothetical protein